MAFAIIVTIVIIAFSFALVSNRNIKRNLQLDDDSIKDWHNFRDAFGDRK